MTWRFARFPWSTAFLDDKTYNTIFKILFLPTFVQFNIPPPSGYILETFLAPSVCWQANIYYICIYIYIYIYIIYTYISNIYYIYIHIYLIYILYIYIYMYEYIFRNVLAYIINKKSYFLKNDFNNFHDFQTRGCQDAILFT